MRRYLTTPLAATLCIGCVLACFFPRDGEPPEDVVPSAPPTPPQSRPRHQPPTLPADPVTADAAWRRIARHLRDADRAAVTAANRARYEVFEFFFKRQGRVRVFAEQALSLRSKWERMKGDGDSRHFLHGLFERTVFSAQELQDHLRVTLGAYEQEVQGIENELLVKLRADLADGELGAAGLVSVSEEVFRAEYAKLMAGASQAVKKDLRISAGREAVSIVGAEATTMLVFALARNVAARLGSQPSALSSPSLVVSLGVGIGAAMLIDALLDWFVRSIGHDPVTDLEIQASAAFDDFYGLLLDGDRYEPYPRLTVLLPKDPDRDYKYLLIYQKQAERWQQRRKEAGKPARGLVAELSHAQARRAAARNAALKRLVGAEGGDR